MNIIKYTFLLITILFNYSNEDILKQDGIVGEWIGTDYWQNKSEFIFTSDKRVSMTIEGKKIGGENFEINGVKAELLYEIDETKEPSWIDLIALEKDKKVEKGRILGIIKFNDENNFEILLNLKGGDRSINFDKNNEQLIIKMTRKNQ